MQMQQERLVINTRSVAVDMLFFLAQMVVLGIAVAVAVSVPVILWAITR